jgi:putative hydrolases of HD superfamily
MSDDREERRAAEPPGREDRLKQQLGFILEIDKLKQVLRRTPLLDQSRRENSAEHSWHLAMMAVILAEYADHPVDLARVILMLLLHDVVEIDAGDTFLYDDSAKRDQAEREQRAADRIFGLLPNEQGAALRAAWDEFEAQETNDARFARALDRLQPLLHNYHTQGGTWSSPGVTFDRVVSRKQVIAAGSSELWAHAEALLKDAAARGFLRKDGAGAP